MTRAERLAILGAEDMAEIHRRVAAAPEAPPEVLDDLRHIFAPALARLEERAPTAIPRHSASDRRAA